jgi:2-amino-4-hydroxy-6-hydroxymethyldihydropteridine diphosphokinase
MKHFRVFLGVGTNLGNRIANLEAAQLEVSKFVVIVKTSRIFETKPWGFLEQPDFLNQVWEVSTTLSPLELLSSIKQMEFNFGRKPSVKYGPRLIDIDILLYSDLTFKSSALTIPHPHISERAFVLAPLADLEPEMIIPGSKKTIRELLRQQDQNGFKPAEKGI